MKRTRIGVFVVMWTLGLVILAACSPQDHAPFVAKDGPQGHPQPKEAEEEVAASRAFGYLGRHKGSAVPAALVAPAEKPAPGGGAGLLPAVRDGRKVVRNARIVLAAEDTGEAMRRLTRIAPSFHGYVAGISSAKDGDLMCYVLTLKVPADSFERVLEEVKTVALRVDAETVSTEDVTDQYVDLDARFRALRGTEKELLGLLSESRSRGSKVADIMEVFGELTSIRTQIEQIQGQMRKMEQISEFSTLEVTVRPDALSRPVVTASWRPSETLHADLAALARIGRGLVDLGIGVLVLGLPAALVAILLGWALLRMHRAYRRVTRRPMGAA